MRTRNWYWYAVTAKIESGITVGKICRYFNGGGTKCLLSLDDEYCSDLAQGGHRKFTNHASNKIMRHINNRDLNDVNWIKRMIKILRQ